MMKIYGQVCFKMSTSVITASPIWTKVCHSLEEVVVKDVVLNEGSQVTSTGGVQYPGPRMGGCKERGG